MPQTLLLADDSVTIQRVIELTFADEAINVVAVSNGDQAIARLDAPTPPDIVLADIGMPGKTGYEVAEYIKRSPRLSHIPVVLLTGAFEPVDQAKANAVGCDGVLAKPFEPQLVISRVKELLSKPARPAPPPGTEATLASAPAAPAASDSWLASFAEQPAANAGSESGGGKLDDYFDRLDAAFASFSSGSASASDAAKGSVPPAVPSEIDWFGSQPTAAPSPDLPMSFASPQTDFIPPPPVHMPTPQRMVAPTTPFGTPEPVVAPAGSSAPASLPPLADAFAALLAAEQRGTAPAAAPLWPAGESSPAQISDELIEEVTRRVLDRLSDRVVRETVTGIVSQVAERLVKEEIERIKSGIK